MIYMPYVANVIAIGIVWSIVLNPFQGPINALLRLAGVPEASLPQWLMGVKSSLPTLAGIKVWQNLAFQTIVFLAALQEVPRELYECAQIDGAGWWRKLFRITLPVISPTTFFLIVVTVIGSFNSFAIVKALTNGGPGSATRIITLFIYDQAFRYSYYSYSNALACLLFLFILLVTLLQWKAAEAMGALLSAVARARRPAAPPCRRCFPSWFSSLGLFMITPFVFMLSASFKHPRPGVRGAAADHPARWSSWTTSSASSRSTLPSVVLEQHPHRSHHGHPPARLRVSPSPPTPSPACASAGRTFYSCCSWPP